MFKLRRFVADVTAAVTPEAPSVWGPNDKQVPDDSSTCGNAGRATYRSIERDAFSAGNVSSLVILAQCVP
jgi:hypothetical protein